MSDKVERPWLKVLADLPMTNIVVLVGLFVALATGTRYLMGWDPGDKFEEWLLFVFALVTGNYAAKRFSYKQTPPNGPDVEDAPASQSEHTP